MSERPTYQVAELSEKEPDNPAKVKKRRGWIARDTEGWWARIRNTHKRPTVLGALRTSVSADPFLNALVN